MGGGLSEEGANGVYLVDPEFGRRRRARRPTSNPKTTKANNGADGVENSAVQNSYYCMSLGGRGKKGRGSPYVAVGQVSEGKDE